MLLKNIINILLLNSSYQSGRFIRKEIIIVSAMINKREIISVKLQTINKTANIICAISININFNLPHYFHLKNIAINSASKLNITVIILSNLSYQSGRFTLSRPKHVFITSTKKQNANIL